MITTSTGAKKIEGSDNWREIFDAHNDSVDAQDKLAPDMAPIVNGNKCVAGASAGDYVLVRNSSITGITDGAYIAAQAIPANTAIDSTYLTAISGGALNSLNSKLAVDALYEGDAFGSGTSKDLSGSIADYLVVIVLFKTNVNYYTMAIPNPTTNRAYNFYSQATEGSGQVSNWYYLASVEIKFTSNTKIQCTNQQYSNGNWTIRPCGVYGLIKK